MSGKLISFLFLNLVFLFLSSNISVSQSSYPLYDVDLSPFWDFYSNNRMSTINAGKGYSGIASENDISGIVLNPASLSLTKKFQVHAEYVFKSDVPGPPQTTTQSIKLTEIHPSFMLSGGYKLNDYFETGLMFYSANNQRTDFKDIVLETGNSDAVIDMSINTFALPLVVNYMDKVKVGVNLLYSLYHGYCNFVTTVNNPGQYIDGKVNFAKFNAQFGILVTPIKDFSIGATFTPKVEEIVVWEYSDGTSEALTQPNVFPMKLGIGGEYRFRNIPLKIGFDYNYVNTSKLEGLKDRNDFHIGVEYDVLKELSVRTGFFTLKDYRSYPFPNDEYFLTIGGTYKFKNFTASISVMDSHMYSTGSVTQTLVNGGLTMDFK